MSRNYDLFVTKPTLYCWGSIADPSPYFRTKVLLLWLKQIILKAKKMKSPTQPNFFFFSFFITQFTCNVNWMWQNTVLNLFFSNEELCGCRMHKHEHNVQFLKNYNMIKKDIPLQTRYGTSITLDLNEVSVYPKLCLCCFREEILY